MLTHAIRSYFGVAEPSGSHPSPQPRLGRPTGFTLVEMLVAMAITLVMMAAVVTLFANVSNSVSQESLHDGDERPSAASAQRAAARFARRNLPGPHMATAGIESWIYRADRRSVSRGEREQLD